MNGVVSLAGVLAMLLLVGGAIGLADRRCFDGRWLLIAAGLVALNDCLVTRCYRLIANLVPGSDRNWQGMAMALAAILVIAALPAFGWRRSGLTLAQDRGSLRAALPVAAVYAGIFLALALASPAEPASGDEIAFQLTMPGLMEEAFYRGVLLYALDRAFTRRLRFLAVDWGWGAVLSCALFGLDHAFGYGRDGFSFDALTMALTALPSFVAVWLRLRTGSVLLPAVLHNLGNSLSLLV